MLRQKVRASWLKLGDTNSRFYHFIIRWRRCRNELKVATIDGVWVEEP